MHLIFCFPGPFLRRSLKSVRTELLQQLQNLQGAPSVQMQEVPPPYERVHTEEADDGKDDDTSGTGGGNKKRKAHASELYDKVD
jgi:hypothetical protein